MINDNQNETENEKLLQRFIINSPRPRRAHKHSKYKLSEDNNGYIY